jgi:hypothetical protein
LPDGITIGDLPPGLRCDSVLLDAVPAYRDCIHVTDGARMGVVDFYSFADLPNHQAAATVLPGGRECWLCVGHVLYDPLVLELASGSLYQMDSDGGADSLRGVGPLDDFLLSLLDRRYLQTTGVSPDRWFALLQRLGFAG